MLRDLAVVGRRRNLAWNLIAWSCFVYTNVADDNGRFSFALDGDATVIFDNDFFGGAIGNRHGVCNPGKSVSTFSSSDSTQTVSYENYNENRNCNDIFIPESFGYNSVRSGTSTFSVDLDVRR
jgi:hypothetical protein